MIADPADYWIRISYIVSFMMFIISESGRKIYSLFFFAVTFLHFHGFFRNFSISAPIPLYAGLPP
jgi:hypothetical protein